MEQSADEVVEATDEKDAKLPWIYVFRQVLVSSGVWTIYFTLGLCLGSPTVIVPQIRRQANSSDVISEETVSWLSSTYSYSGTILVILLTFLSRYMGRKPCFLLVSILSMGGFILMYFSKVMLHLIISAVINGVLTASQVSINLMIITEYSSPEYRGAFLTIKSASFLWGVWVAKIIGTFIHWKYIALVGCVLTAYIFITTLIWPESPLWLASKRRFDECAVSHHWLKGHNRRSEKELYDVVNFYKQSLISDDEKEKRKIGKTLKGYIDMFCEKCFYKPFLLSTLINLLYNSLGKMMCTVYAFDILRSIMNSESAAYTGMLILDGVTIIGAYIGSGVSKFVRRRSLMLVTTSTGIIFLYLLSLCIYLSNLGILSGNMYIPGVLLSVYSLAVSSGPLIMASSLLSELIPVTNRNTFALINGIFGNFCFATFLKLAPLLFTLLDFYGIFLLYAVLSTIFGILLYIFLPETKDKTLVEIEMTIKLQ
ncbi:facilitated trehalose transporter Tret1-like [Battus philenor]|uniref:facilitated trehalose transporter Tret1-like n=1 Tax=Battus philenor TaxID=42288 RepID=UPI0035D017B6